MTKQQQRVFPCTHLMKDLTEKMSGYNRSTNPFLTEDQDDFKKPSGFDPIMDRRENLQQQIGASEDRQVDMTRRILGSMYESERVGVDTAEVFIF